MMDSRHNNPWAERLYLVTLPDPEAAWTALEQKLGETAALRRRNRWRRWLLVIVLLLLLVGVCNCPGRRSFLSGRSAGPTAPTTPATPATSEAPATPAGSRQVAKDPSSPISTNQPTTREPQRQRATKSDGRLIPPVTATPASLPAIPAAAPAKPDHRAGSGARSPGRNQPESAIPNAPGAGAPHAPKLTAAKTHHGETPAGEATAGETPASNEPTQEITRRETGSPAKPSRGKVARPAPQHRTNHPTTDSGEPDSAQPRTTSQPVTPAPAAVATSPERQRSKAPAGTKTSPPHRSIDTPAKTDETERQGGFMAGIGLNQFFTVGGQHASSYNSGGITGTLADYIPVPMLRYYVNPNLYLQLEGQINTPQYTKKNLVALSTPVDSLAPQIHRQTTVSINKLFYFNVPLSVHYTVYHHLDIGAGLQYSRLTNGVGVFNNQYNISGVQSDSVETKSFRGDSVYKRIRTEEFRFLVDANYMWRRCIIGLRYNQALSKFIHVELSPGQVTQARNSSLQLYLRYILWDGRKKGSGLPAK